MSGFLECCSKRYVLTDRYAMNQDDSTWINNPSKNHGAAGLQGESKPEWRTTAVLIEVQACRGAGCCEVGVGS